MRVNGDLLKGKIVSRGYNYETLSNEAKKLGYSLSTTSISNVVTNKNKPSYSTMTALYTILNLTPQEGNEIFFDKKLHETGI